MLFAHSLFLFPAWIRSSAWLVNQTWFTIKYGTRVSLFSYTSLLLNHLKQSPTNTGFLKQSIQITVHRGPGSREPNYACVRIFNHPILGRIIRSNFLRPCSLAFIIFFTSKISLTTIFLCNQAYGITPNPSDFMAFRVAFMYYEFLNWQCLLDGNLQLFVEVLSCRNCC